MVLRALAAAPAQKRRRSLVATLLSNPKPVPVSEIDNKMSDLHQGAQTNLTATMRIDNLE